VYGVNDFSLAQGTHTNPSHKAVADQQQDLTTPLEKEKVVILLPVIVG
jgi:hypothetical protein